MPFHSFLKQVATDTAAHIEVLHLGVSCDLAQEINHGAVVAVEVFAD